MIPIFFFIFFRCRFSCPCRRLEYFKEYIIRNDAYPTVCRHGGSPSPTPPCVSSPLRIPPPFCAKPHPQPRMHLADIFLRVFKYPPLFFKKGYHFFKIFPGSENDIFQNYLLMKLFSYGNNLFG